MQVPEDTVAHYGCKPQRKEPPSVDTHVLEMLREHADVLAEAQQIHVDRTPVRGELWLDDGRDKMIDCAHDKVVRLAYAIKMDLPFKEDDALDAINYLAFAIRCNRRGRFERDYGPDARDADPSEADE